METEMSNGKNLKHILERVYSHESLAGIDLRNLYLSYINFSGLDLRAANLEGCCLNHALLDDCDLTDANLCNAKLTQASFNRHGSREPFLRMLSRAALRSRAQRD